MSQAKDGDKVRVHYTGKLENGTVFDSSTDREPLEFTIGSGNIIPGFEKGVVGMTAGEKKTVTVSPEEAYGTHNDELTITVDRSRFPDHIKPELGQQLLMDQAGGKQVEVIITGIEDDKVTLDANHPLAGKTLIFDVELVSID